MKKAISLSVAGLLCAAAIFLSLNVQAVEKTTLDQVLGQLYERPASVQILEDEDLGRIASLELSNEPDSGIIYTFDSNIEMSGTAEKDDRIDIAVFTVDADGSPIIWHRNSTVIGASGLIQERIPLTLIGLQHLLIGVTHDEKTSVRVYEINRKSDQVLDQLLNYKLNLYEEFGKR